MMTWLTARLREPSTWRGLIWLLTACGVTLRPEVWEQITAIGMATAGLLGVLIREEPKTVKIELPPIELQGRPAVIAPLYPDREPTPDRLHDPKVRTRINTESARTARTHQQPEPPESPGWNG